MRTIARIRGSQGSVGAIVAVALLLLGVAAWFALATPSRSLASGISTPTPAPTPAPSTATAPVSRGPIPWSLGDCSWASSILLQDAANDVANDPHTGTDASAYLKLSAESWRVDEALVRAVCRQAFDAEVAPGWAVSTQPPAAWTATPLSTAGCGFAVGSIDFGRWTHQVRIDANKGTDWDRQWAANYVKLSRLFETAGCPQPLSATPPWFDVRCPPAPVAENYRCIAELWRRG